MMDSGRAEAARREEGVGESANNFATLGSRSQPDFQRLQSGVEAPPSSESVFGEAPSEADAKENPKRIGHGKGIEVYTELGAAVTSSGGPIQVQGLLEIEDTHRPMALQ